MLGGEIFGFNHVYAVDVLGYHVVDPRPAGHYGIAMGDIISHCNLMAVEQLYSGLLHLTLSKPWLGVNVYDDWLLITAVDLNGLV